MSDRDEIPPSFSPEDALVAVMVAVSAADETVNSRERASISRIVDYLPVFANYDTDRIPVVNQIVYDLLEELDGLDALFGLVRDALPENLEETAYALACDVAASDGNLSQSELRILEEMRYELKLDRLHAAAIERGARARHIYEISNCVQHCEMCACQSALIVDQAAFRQVKFLTIKAESIRSANGWHRIRNRDHSVRFRACSVSQHHHRWVHMNTIRNDRAIGIARNGGSNHPRRTALHGRHGVV